eukprot:Nitzschia sp. Nitz4//scaffold205_size38804//6903//9374//NITZ4_007640-RA/size38804-augustus-gene-0.58-mRNA-1//-1//CDS//3329541501//4158//frame0
MSQEAPEKVEAPEGAPAPVKEEATDTVDTTTTTTTTTTTPDQAMVEAAVEEAVTAVLPSSPTERDVCFGVTTHKATMILLDLIRLHYLVLKQETPQVGQPPFEKEVPELATRLFKLMKDGKTHELSGLKDVPRPFLKGPGYFFERSGADGWSILDPAAALEAMTKLIQEIFLQISQETAPPSPELTQSLDEMVKNCDPANKAADEPSPFSAPRPCDVLFLPVEFTWEENMPYEHQSGNKHLLFLASQHVAADTSDSAKRVEAAFRLVTSKIDVNAGTELLQKTPRYVAQELKDNQNAWRELDKKELAEFACIFTFEVFLEKQIHGMGVPLSAQVANLISDTAKPSTVPIDNPTPHDVLFGRGGMTNGHVGNRRFRDIIALHRPDYVRATKMDKPNVARRIVRAIRQGNPSGRFLKKNDDGKWYDVGDRVAAEKTSQGLRERSNAEKRQRSALREALRIRREDMEEDEKGDDEGSAKKRKVDVPMGHSLIVPSYVGVASQLNYTGGIPLSLSMKETPKDGKGKKGKKAGEEGEDENSESLPPNAVDKDGNILVTDYDILCGRGGLTNHHKGNKRFRDIVALHRPDYVRAPKIQKPSVARVIVRAIRNGDPPGRFLKKDEKTGKWYDVGDKKAAEKTSQALREKTGEEKDQSSSASFQSPTHIAPGPVSQVTATEASSAPGVEVKTEKTNGQEPAPKAADTAAAGEIKKEDKVQCIEI